MSSPITVGIWGLGRAGQTMHVPELAKYADLFRVGAGCDIDNDRCAAMRERCPDCSIYTDVDKFLADPDIELVSIATRSPDHVAHALAALGAGKYVFLEKPIALSYADALRLEAADQQFPGKLYCRHNRRFEPAFIHIREIIASGILGEVYEIKLRRNNYQRRNDWQTRVDCGGGQLNNWGPHLVDHALQFLESPVKSLWSNLKCIAAAGDAEDHLKLLFTGENGRVVDLEISGGAAIREPEYIVLGRKGGLSCSGKTITLRYIDPDQQLIELEAIASNPPLTGGFGNRETLNWIEQTLEVAPAHPCQMHSIWQHLHAAIRANVPFPITLQEALEVVRYVDLAKQQANR